MLVAQGHLAFSLPFALLGPVVRKPVQANPGLKFNPGSQLSCLKEFALLILPVSEYLKETKVKNYVKKGFLGTPIAWV